MPRIYKPMPVNKTLKIANCNKLSGMKFKNHTLPPIFLDDNRSGTVSNQKLVSNLVYIVVT